MTFMQDELTRTALDALPADDAREIAVGLGEAFARGLAAARARWPHAPHADLEFARWVGGKLAQQAKAASALPRLRIEDLFLAWWTMRDPEQGIVALWAAHRDDLERLLARFHRLDREELMQSLRVKLFVATADAPARIASYSGVGFLQNWLRVLATRTFLDAARQLERRGATGLPEAGHEDDAPLLALVVEPTDAIGARDRARVYAAIRTAFAASVAALEPRERTFLRLATVDGLTLEQIAAAYRVGRATVARVLAAGRARLRDDTRRGMIHALGIAAVELDSLIRDLDTQLELSLARVLAR
jgi:RNA polymerase sigma-70 factor